jgi:hypothetical protein
MSWRVLFAIILVILGASAWGGIQLGDWLVAHAPTAAAVPNQTALASQEATLDANGRPFVAQPPQPRLDGSLGVPDKPEGSSWAIPTVSLFDTPLDPSVKISRDNVTLEEARQIAAASNATPLPPGTSDIATLDLQGFAPTAPPPNQGGYAVANNNATPSSSSASGSARSANWQDELKRELAQCANTGFFQRPTCSWNARNKYCEPNRAWGQVSDCPARP